MAWWRHQMETFSALLAICAGNSPVPGEFPTQRPVTRSFDVYFDLRPNKWLSKQSWGWWFETLSCSLWRHRNGLISFWVLNLSPLSAAYMRRWTGSALVQIMACRLNGAKPLSKPVLTYCQLDPKERISMKFYLKVKYFHSRKCVWTNRLWNGGHFVQGEMS